MATTLESPQETALERCDACGAQAYVKAVLPSGGELLFCAHHARKHDERLRVLMAEITDETERLTAGT